MYVISPSRPCAESKCAPLWANLLYSITISPAMAVKRATELRAEWIYVPCCFWWAVWVGWRIRRAWIRKRKAVELRSCVHQSISILLFERGLMGRKAYRMGGEEHQVVGEDGAPDYGCYYPDAGLDHYSRSLESKSVEITAFVGKKTYPGRSCSIEVCHRFDWHHLDLPAKAPLHSCLAVAHSAAVSKTSSFVTDGIRTEKLTCKERNVEEQGVCSIGRVQVEAVVIATSRDEVHAVPRCVLMMR